MRIWLDLSNSPHVLLFAPVARRLAADGHTVLVTARDNAQTVELARQRWPSVDVLGAESPRGVTAKAGSLAGRVRSLAAWARRNDVDVALSHNSYAQIVAAAIRRIPVVTAMDFEHQPANHLAFRLSTRVLLPRALDGNEEVRRQGAGRRARYYDGFKEEIALGDFEPDAEILQRIGVDAPSGTTVVVARTPPSRALYHRFENPLFLYALEQISSDAHSRCVILCRHPEQRDELRRLGLANCTIPDRAVDSRSLMAAADLVLGAGGTMTREAALLGVPTVSVFAGRRSAVDAQLEREGRLRFARRAADIVPVRPRAAPPRHPDDLRTRADVLVDRFIAVVEEVAHVRRASVGSISSGRRRRRSPSSRRAGADSLGDTAPRRHP
jgi:predicted glycosyltransferase